ncbi:MAG: DUF2922 domain-containing protein [Oscillospiraceae bacterium]|nr:DUF2922 domain-containing protein [Oscillospiraceae bacterium]
MMDTVTLSLTFQDENGKKFKIKLNDIRSDVTSAEVLVLANKFIDDDVLVNKGAKIVEYLSAEKIIVERLELI